VVAARKLSSLPARICLEAGVDGDSVMPAETLVKARLLQVRLKVVCDLVSTRSSRGLKLSTEYPVDHLVVLT